nr:gamma-tubulin complex component 6-like isoform X2 [Procambarus clarkii]
MHTVVELGELCEVKEGLPLNGPRTSVPRNAANMCQAQVTPAVESTVYLVRQLVAHFSKDCQKGIIIRDKTKETYLQRRLKKLVFSVLLSYRKDYKTQNTNVKLTEVEEIIWQTFMLRHHRRYDDGNSLERCLQYLKNYGYLEAGSDVRNVLKFLVALRGFGGDVKKKVDLAELTPRIVHVGKNQPNYLPSGPLQYGDTFLQSAEYRPHYMHFPPGIFSLSSSSIEAVGYKENTSPFGVEAMMNLSKALPGTGVSPLLLGRNPSETCGKVLGALLQDQSKELTPDAVLSIPDLPSEAQGYSYFSHLPKALPSSSPSAVGSDEGYASSRAANIQTPEDDVEDVWEAVLQGPPLTSRRTWETLDHVPLNKEKLFLSEAGPESSHNIWLLYQEFWGSLGDHYVPSLYVRSMEELCQDLMNLMIGVPSRSFLWCEESESFCVKDGLCYPGVTPEHLQGSLLPFVECGTLVRRLEVVCVTPKFDTQHLLTQGSVYRAFTVAISNVLQVYRGMVFTLSGETHLSRLQERAQHLLKKIKFVAHLFQITSNCYKNGNTPRLLPDSTAVNIGISHRLQHTSVNEECHQEMLRGLNLLSELLNQVILTKDRACLLLLISIFRNSCAPFLRYLEDWIYEGVCSDPGQEFMIDVDGRSLLRQDRNYWTKGYTLRDLSSIPVFFRDVLQEAFTCGKALNLLKLCSVKHHLVQAGSTKHPSLKLCISGEELEQMHHQCEAYAAHMLYLAAQNQVSAQQKAEQEIEEKQRLTVISSEKQAAIISEFERKMEHVRQKEAEQKKSQFDELKEEMLKARERKLQDKQREVEEDWRIGQEFEMKEAKKLEAEEKLRAKMESYYHQKMFVAERSEALAHWKVQRCLLSEARKQYILGTDWSPQEKDAEAEKSKEVVDTPVEDTHSTVDIVDDVSPFKEQCPIPSVPYLEHNVHHRNLPKSLQNIESGIFDQKQININENFLGEYTSHIEKNDDVKESPIQELSSVSDMTTSLMSTSSDLIETPFDENLPDFEVDLKRPVSSEKNLQENKFSSVYGKSSIDSILYNRPDGFDVKRSKRPTYMPVSSIAELSSNKNNLLEKEYGVASGITESAQRLVTEDIRTSSTYRIFGEPVLDSKTLAVERNPSNAIKEDFGNRGRETAATQDTNANFPGLVKDEDENGNSGDSYPFTVDDINANIASEKYTPLPGPASVKENGFQDPNKNITLADNISETKDVIGKNSTIDIKVSGDDSNGNIISQNINEVLSQYKERCAQAAAIKQKVLKEEFQSTTESKNTMNILRSKSVPSSLAVKNKQKVLEIEYGLPPVEGPAAEDKHVVTYSRQVSGASTSSYKSCSLFERQTSSSTAFTTPDEERPILIDQVGGEVLKERGRSIHGHASDAIIHKLLWRHNQEPMLSPTEAMSDMTPIEDLLSSVRHSVLYKAEPYNVENFKLMDSEPLLDITGTALNGRPNTRQPRNKKLPPVPSASELSCAPIYFMRSIRMHLATQTRLVNASLLSEVLVQESLLDHLSALRALLLLHDAHFARALTLNLSSKVDMTSSPAALLVPVELNNILNRSVSESCWTTSQQAENLSFAIKSIPSTFTHTTSVVDCLELRYHVRWPHTLILDDATLASYSRVWNFLASLHYSIWAADDLFCHLSYLCRQDKEGHFLKCSQYHQVCLYRHEMHHFLLVVQAYVISQVHQISWSKFEQKLHKKVSSLDELYDLHSSLVTSINSRCFLTQKGSVVQKLVRDVFSLMLRFRSQYLSHSWQTNAQTNMMEHPGFIALKSTYQEFQKHSAFLHKSLLEEEDKLQECW